jgi:uncharacterized coiled-coil DUF342 family protein
MLSLKEAIECLDKNDDSHWTSTGLPRIEVLKELTENGDISRETIEEACPGFTRAGYKKIKEKVTEILDNKAELRSELLACQQDISNVQKEIGKFKNKLLKLFQDEARLLAQIGGNSAVNSNDEFYNHIQKRQKNYANRAKGMSPIDIAISRGF